MSSEISGNHLKWAILEAEKNGHQEIAELL